MIAHDFASIFTQCRPRFSLFSPFQEQITVEVQTQRLTRPEVFHRFIPKRRLGKAGVLIFCFFTHSLDFFGHHNYSMELKATHTMKHYPRISLRNNFSHIGASQNPQIGFSVLEWRTNIPTGGMKLVDVLMCGKFSLGENIVRKNCL